MDVAVYYFPNWHVDPKNEAWHGRGWTEWELVRNARPRFPGHQQPKVPAWGHFNEADPAWAGKEIDLAADHGITAFLYDWYWHDDGPFLQRQLEEGFLKAANRQRLKFALMWANHDWLHMFPADYLNRPPVLMPGVVSRATWEKLTDYVVEKYFAEPNYLKIEGCPYFSIFELSTFCRGPGSVAAARESLRSFRDKTRKAGFPDLHVNVVSWGLSRQLPEEIPNRVELVRFFDAASITDYGWYTHFDGGGDFPTTDYQKVARVSCAKWQEYRQGWPVDYYPHVSMGWDPSPRTVQSDRYENRSYPFCAVWRGNTPEAWKAALQKARAFAEAGRDKHKMVTLNAWNEWTEGSYLLPDTQHGTAYLQAVREVFGSVAKPAPMV